MDIDNIKIMSIGGNCRNIPILGKDRIRGPIDNIQLLGGLSDTKIIFEDSLVSMVKTETPIQEKRNPTFPGDSDTLYTYSHFQVVHNNPLTDKYLEELEKRMDNFRNFRKKVEMDPNYYFIYAMSIGDVVLDTQDIKRGFLDGLQYLSQLGLLHKTIIFGTTCECTRYFYHIKDSEVLKQVPLYIQIDKFFFHDKTLEDQFHKKLLGIL